ncbi:MAG: GldM family protein [Chitinophagales bacterium]
MKNLLLLIASIFLLFTSFFFKETLEDREVLAVISADKMNLLHIGVDNPISVAISGIPIEATKVSIDKGEITPNSQKGQYIVRVFEVGEVTISLEGRDKQGNVVQGLGRFRVERMPNPTPMLGNKAGGVISMGEMKAQRGLLAVLLNFDIDARYDVLHYKVTRIRTNEPSIVLENKGAVFSEEVKSLIEGTAVEDLYFFFDIEVNGPDGFIRKLQEVGFKVE